jgi:hypothetical protein
VKFEDALRDVFDEKADQMTSEHRRMLRAVWEHGRQEGRGSEKSAFDQGRSAGLCELGVFFTKVLRMRPMDRVFFLRSSRLEYQPWARAALQQVMDAPDLEEAERIAAELGKLSTEELMRRAGDRPPPVLEEARQQRHASETEVLEGLWDRDGELERMDEANRAWDQWNRRRR